MYDEVFKTLADEDRQFLDDDEELVVLDFGNSQSNFEEVSCDFIFKKLQVGILFPCEFKEVSCDLIKKTIMSKWGKLQ